MPCYQRQTFTNKLIESGDSTVDRKSLEIGLSNTGLKLELTSSGSKFAIQDRETGSTIAYIDGNTISIYGGTPESRERQTDRIREAYSVGVVVKQASTQYWSPQVRKVGNSYFVDTEVNY